MKYGASKAATIEIDNLIQQIQSDCLVVSQDKGKYAKIDDTDIADDNC